jgi:ribosomal protein S18 acetylase RimI-like enzyme
VTAGPAEVVVVAATAGDLPAVLPLHEQAFAGSMGVSLGRPYLRRFLASFLDRPDRVFLVAEEGDRPVGYVFGRPVVASGDDDRRLALVAGWGVLSHPSIWVRADVRAELLRRARSVRQPAPPAPTLPAPVLSLVGIGTDPERRGRGIAAGLLAAFAEEAAQRGYASTRLSVYRENATARRVYERAGWRPLDHPANPALLYYARDLDPPKRTTPARVPTP